MAMPSWRCHPFCVESPWRKESTGSSDFTSSPVTTSGPSLAFTFVRVVAKAPFFLGERLPHVRALHLFGSTVYEHVFCGCPFDSHVASRQEPSDPGDREGKALLRSIRWRIRRAFVKHVFGIRDCHQGDQVQHGLNVLVAQVMAVDFSRPSSIPNSSAAKVDLHTRCSRWLR